MKSVAIRVNPDNMASDMGYEIVNEQGEVFCEVPMGSRDSWYGEWYQHCCLPTSGHLTLICNDRAGDGWDATGYYTPDDDIAGSIKFVDGNLYCDDFGYLSTNGASMASF